MKKTFLAVALLASLAACRSQAPDAVPAPAEAPPVEEHYVGTLPCPDCKGIDADLVLYRDDRTNAPDGYELTETFQGSDDADGDDELGSEGDWAIEKGTAKDPNASVIVLRPEDGSKPRYFVRVNDQELRELDDKRGDLDPKVTASLYKK